MHTVQTPRETLVDRIRQVEFLSLLPSEHLELLARSSMIREGDKGEVLFRQGQVGAQFLWLMEGGLRLTRTQPDGREKVIHLFSSPALVAEAAILLGQPLPATATLTGPSRILHIDRGAVREAVQTHPDLALNLLGSVMLRLRELTRSLANHGQSSGVARVAAYLLGRVDESGALVLPASKKDVASYLGMQPESFSRALAALKQQGLIEVRDQQIQVCDLAALSAVMR
ncbi:MAG: Crp/Fnr family transcriptional regulator [Deltaproteobacteria bacterium]|nr:Crp/Fnr family transcriptional regulator [Deltaproteobacteria bacterium]